MGKKLVMAQKRGETRALCLGVAMVMCAVIAYYILGTTMLPLYQKSVWTQKSTCHLIETNIREQEELEGKKVPQYPCLWVNVSAVGRWAVLYHTEDTRDQNHQCSYIPGSLENYQVARADVEKVKAKFHEQQIFYCFSTTRENETTVLYRRLYGPQTLLFSLFWPTFLLTGGLLIIAMVKINQSLSILAAQR
ncbi:calcium-activated potassium channel subunit beta-1 [Canis lupus familiaris]|uniref:Calcium-activated potassium channel subunit beta-1 n=1 Tax=Canis lupus familiaris TaxID=9615 RepID=KCMB1_CANLF|nr:calcium-activated potassium channel subunit beta-1 [Canis lupus familiaris]Q28266.3 RecName: Full=Calcium-activated potassium channel subunit beta-1; AltName: Full=BK channel subunit beta-1; Short=BKbeta; Short=BKbeta1; AltName: Full=Calcium-activated potassium channel, subfamily M subunit beta-1; Short=Calcium-activated potassium channel subunit beta; AltName: Full=Charybdotoxin receptor subunit beta-1; AltName: Full=K(VCA)beta-1; AltName: Full=Maxi K channel subunit beta-1; AltName: Full=Slo-|eukprot:NP_001003299.1 calcium-activated potassium channel subunit beta-1 [Canis lupus familiaris]